MSHSDKRISAAIAIVILIHIAILILGLTIPVLSSLIALVNLMVSASILIYGIQKQIRITKHFIELREIIVLCFEFGVVSCTIYSLLIHQQIRWLYVVNFIILGFHLLVMILFFIFMITFKMKKLF